MWRDLRIAARLLRRAPVFTAAATLTMALGAAANVAVFSVVNAYLLRPLPVRDSGRLVVIASERRNDAGLGGLSYPDLDDLRGGLLVGDPGGGDGGLEPDAALGIGGGFLEEGGVVGEAVVMVTHDADGGGAEFTVLTWSFTNSPTGVQSWIRCRYSAIFFSCSANPPNVKPRLPSPRSAASSSVPGLVTATHIGGCGR